MSRTRIAVAGAGYIGRAHIDAARHSTTVMLSAVVDPSPDAKAHADAAGVPLYASLAELFSQDKPDGMVLATPNQLHVPQAMQCIAAGVPTLLEKPIAQTVAQAETLVRAVEASQARVLIGHHRAHSPIMAKAREVVASGALGRLVAVTGTGIYKARQTSNLRTQVQTLLKQQTPLLRQVDKLQHLFFLLLLSILVYLSLVFFVFLI